jgi:hypothetical protein
MSGLVVKQAETLVERICDRLTSDPSKVVVYTVYRVSKLVGILILGLVVGVEALGFIAGLI